MSDSENEDGVFENIAEQMKNKFVTKKKYSRKVSGMKRELQKKDQELQKMRVEYDREKLKNDIIIAEKKVVESRFNEIELKLKLKTQEYDELLMSKKFNDKITEKNLIGIQTIEKESSTAKAVAVEATAQVTTSSSTISSAAST